MWNIVVNDARAVRVAELINDYRTLQLHISQQRMEVPAQEQHEEGFTVMRECLDAAQRLLSSQYNLASIQNQGADDEAQKVQLQRYPPDCCRKGIQRPCR